MSIGIMECWNLGMMDLKKPGFKTHMISFSHAQYSNVPLFSPRRRLRLYEPEAIIPYGSSKKWPQENTVALSEA